MPEGDEHDLIRMALRGSEWAFGRLIELYQPVVHSVVTGIVGHRHESEDIVQEVFIKVYRGLSSFRGESKLSTWIYRIARNEALNALAKLKTSTTPIEETYNIGTMHGNPEENYNSKKIRKQLHRMISRLAEHQRIAVELRYMGEKSYSEISVIMDIPVGTVKTHIHRAKIALKDMLASCGAEGKKGHGF